MPELANLPIASLLRLQPDTRGQGPVIAAKVAAHRAAANILLARAPELTRQRPGTCLSQKQRQGILGDVSQLKPGDHRVAVHRAIDHVICDGNARGVWKISSLGAIAQHALAPSSFKVEDAEAMHRVQCWRAGLIEKLPALLESKDPLILGGLVIAAAVVFDAVLIADFLPKLLTLGPTIRLGPDHTWIAFDYPANPKSDSSAKNLRVRRWVLSTIASEALKRFQELPAEARLNLSAVRALGSIAKLLGLSFPSDAKVLLQTSRAWWSLHLSPAQLYIATTKAAVESLPDHAMERLVRGVRLPGTRSPASGRMVERTAATWRRVRAKRALGVASLDQSLQLAAYKALARLLHRPQRERRRTPAELQALLAAWHQSHDQVGGWVVILAAWVEHVLFERREAGNAKNLRPASIRRYLSSFCPWFLLLAGDLDPAATTSWELLGRLEVLRTLNAARSSAGVMHKALAEFLVFAESRFNAPRVDLVDAWGIPPKSGCPDANILTPDEFKRVLEDLDKHFVNVPGCYLHQRARVITILCYRAGLRWLEIASMSFGQVRLLGPPEKMTATLLVTDNPFAQPKTLNGVRKLELADLLSSEETVEVIQYLRRAVGGRLGTTDLGSLLFADPDAPFLPPTMESTHDLIQGSMRRVSGDDSLVFHHLRHSAATFIEWRIFCRGDDCTISNLQYFGQVQSDKFGCAIGGYGARLAKRNNPATHLYALSETLGHIDPEVTYQSYVHLSELGLQSATWQLFPQRQLPTDTRRALRGNASVQSVYKSDYRKRRTPTPTPTPRG